MYMYMYVYIYIPIHKFWHQSHPVPVPGPPSPCPNWGSWKLVAKPAEMDSCCARLKFITCPGDPGDARCEHGRSDGMKIHPSHCENMSVCPRFLGICEIKFSKLYIKPHFPTQYVVPLSYSSRETHMSRRPGRAGRCCWAAEGNSCFFSSSFFLRSQHEQWDWLKMMDPRKR